jgi:class 3 adenylate cyclase
MTQRQHIVVVDDEAPAREMVGDYLRMQGFEVTLCDGGASLRSVLVSRAADLVVLDLNMPAEDGLSTLRWVKQTFPTPVIMLTATASSVDRVIGLEMGADDYVSKPCELRELLARIRSVLRRQKWTRNAQTGRRLAAIVSLDFVGYGRFIHDDEPATLAAIDRIFGQVMTPTIAQRRGTLFKVLGDGALVEFQSAVDAVEWSISFQEAIARDPASRLAAGDIRFRIGIAAGEVVFKHADRFGETVTIAVRIQEIAEPGAIALTDIVRQFVRGRIDARLLDAGRRILKNVDEPMRVWLWSPAAESRSLADEPGVM